MESNDEVIKSLADHYLDSLSRHSWNHLDKPIQGIRGIDGCYPDLMCNSEHIQWMCEQLSIGKVSGLKANRWLGWIQGVLCTVGYTTVDECRELYLDTVEALENVQGEANRDSSVL